MKAAVINQAGGAPQFVDFADPEPTDGQVMIDVAAAGLHPIVRALADGRHYASDGTYPLIPGVDGVGRLPDGTRVYFGGVRAPFGTLAEYAVAPRGLCVPLPDVLDDATAAGIMNPGLAAWLALTYRAKLEPGETVLVLGATGVSGRMAVHLARQLGAGRVIAAGRNADVLERVGADAVVRLGTGREVDDLRAASGADGIQVIVDYLWGKPTETAITAVSGQLGEHGATPVRLVEVGESAGATITLPASVLRSSGLEILGSGLGSVPLDALRTAIPEFLRIAATGQVPIDLDVVPLSEITTAWTTPRDHRRTVLLP